MSFSSEPAPADFASLTLQQLRGLRRENAALLDQNTRLFEHVVRLQSSMISLQAEVHSLRSELGEIKGDILLLENHNASRHGEVLAIIRRLDEGGVPPAEL